MKNKILLIMISYLMIITAGCGNSSQSEISSSDKVLYKQLKNNYEVAVKYEQENKENITRTINKLCQAYIMSEEEYKKEIEVLEVGVDYNVIEQFTNIARDYKSSERYEDIEKLKEDSINNGNEYTVNVQVSYTRDCIIVNVSYSDISKRLKMTYEDEEIKEMVEYSYYG